MISASLLNLILNFLLSYFFKAAGTASVLVITELYIAIGLHLFLQFKHTYLSIFKTFIAEKL